MVLGSTTAAFAREAGENFLRPLNVQNAYIDTENKYEVRVNFDWFRASSGVGGRRVRTNSYTLPRLEVRRSFDTSIPTRIGLSSSFNVGASDGLANAVGFGNLGITLEAALVNKENFASTLYFNQSIPFQHSPSLSNSLWRPNAGTDAYGFQTGLETQFDLGDHLTVYSDLGYRYDDFDGDVAAGSFVYSTEAVLDTGSPVNFSMGLLGMTTYDDKRFSGRGARLGGTDLRLVPGIIVPIGEERNTQLRVGFPIGMNSDSPDFGVQASIFAAL